MRRFYHLTDGQLAWIIVLATAGMIILCRFL